MESYPKLRALDFQPVLYQDRQMWFLRDPLRLSDIQIFVPAELAPMFSFLDGTRSSKEIHTAFCHLLGTNIPYENIGEAIHRLDMACLLENDRSKHILEEHLRDYRSTPYRVSAIAGNGYPAQADDLAAYLEGFDVSEDSDVEPPWLGRGIISPHIDYNRGGSVYAKVWRQARASIHEADLVIIFGTDHSGDPGSITLTKQPYATPYGTLPLDNELIDKLANTIGEVSAYSAELHHRDEHSIELSAVWLHHTLRQQGIENKPMVPILVGSFHHYISNGDHPANDQQLNSFIEVLKKETAGRKVLAVASVDFAHVGPVFGDNFKVRSEYSEEIKNFDQGLISAALSGDDSSWFQQIAGIQDRNRICGFAPTYLLLRYLGKTNGLKIDYDQCPADPDNTSIVSICGLLID